MIAELRCQCPNLVADWAKASSYILLGGSRADDIIAAHEVMSYLTHHRSHEMGAAAVPPYQAYRQLYPQGQLSRTAFARVYDFTSRVTMDPQEYELTKDSLRAVELWNQLGESKDHIYTYLRTIAVAPGQALRMYRQHMPAQCNMTEREKAFRAAIKLIGMDPRNQPDAVCAVYLSGSDRHDILLENLLVYYACTGGLNPGCTHTALVVSPSPFFIRRWLRDGTLGHVNVTFALDNTDLCDFYGAIRHPARVNYITVDELRQNSSAYQAEIILVFGNHAIGDGYHELVEKLIRAAKSQHTLYYLGPDSYVYRSPLAQLLRNPGVALTDVSLLPAGIHDATDPQRKLLLRCQFGYGVEPKDPNDAIAIRSYALNTKGNSQALTSKPYTAVLRNCEWECDRPPKLRDVYRRGEIEHLRKTAELRNAPLVCPFSAEITVYCACSTNARGDVRAVAYIKDPVSMGTGARLEASIKYTRLAQQSDAEAWAVREYPYSSFSRGGRMPIRDIIGQAYRKVYQGKPITLKTLVYLYPGIEMGMAPIAKRRLYELADSDLGDTLVTHITGDYARAVLDMLYPDETEPAWIQARRALADALDVAVNKGHCQRNEIRDEIKRDAVDHTALQIVRNNLRKQNFGIDELRKIYRRHCNNLQRGKTEHLGALICLLCGLQGNVVCALRWRDFRQMETISQFRGEPIFQLCISRQLINDGTAYRGFEDLHSYRVIPCHPLLAALLLQERERQKREKSYLPDDIFESESIVQGPDMVFAGHAQVVPPKALGRLCRDSLRNILPGQPIPIPEDRYGTAESNLVNYSMDMYRSNFRYYGLRVCQHTAGELAYLLGNQPPTTYDRNYCDYANAKLQLILLIKQDRWISLLEPAAAPTVQSVAAVCDPTATFTARADGARTDAEIALTVPAGEEARIAFSSDYGMSGACHVLKK